MSTPRPDPPRLDADSAGHRVLPVLRRRRAGDAAGHRKSRWPLRHPLSHRWLGRLPREPARRAVVQPIREARRAAHARRRRLHHRTDRCLCVRGRRAHFLPGAHRQRVLSRHGARTRFAAGDGPADRLSAATGCRGRDLAGVHLRDAADTPPPAAKPEPGMFVTGVPARSHRCRRACGAQRAGARRSPAGVRNRRSIHRAPDLECDAALDARSRVDRLRGATFTFLRGVATGLRPGDALLIVGDEFFADHDSNQWDFRILDSVTIDAANDRTLVSWRGRWARSIRLRIRARVRRCSRCAGAPRCSVTTRRSGSP